MPDYSRRKNPQLFEWTRAAAVAGVMWFAANSMRVHPVWLGVLCSVVVGGIALANVEVSVLVAMLLLSVPIAATSPLVAIAFIVFAFLTERYLGGDGGQAFLLIGLALVGSLLGPVWAAAALAGYLLGPAEGALAAALACAAIEIAGILSGRSAVGVTVTGGPSPAILSFAHAPDTLLSGAWFMASLRSLSGASVNRLFGTLGHVAQGAALLGQPALWALGAVAAGVVAQQATRRANKMLGFGAAVAGVAVIAVGDLALRGSLGLPVDSSGIAYACIASVLAALGVVALRTWVFPFEAVPPPVAPRRVSMATEDADVDELLRLISTAEDKLASQHTSQRVVLITDMKSFSRMTEEDGSVLTAKAIQRHRDLLIPIITSHGGCGKSTGGDGVVAAFESASAAVQAAAEAQRALVEHNASHANEREIFVRMGLAEGEVVLDNGGRPFIGAALNLAARVMNLADGGQVFVTGDVAASGASEGVQMKSFGEFELKNIARPVEVVEVLWTERQQAHDPRTVEAVE